MTENDATDPDTVENDAPHRASARKNRGIRFSDPEWDEVKLAAETLGVTPAEFVRARILELVRNSAASDAVSIPANLAPLIERTFRYTYMLATRMRNEMVDRRQADELDKLVNEARALQDDLRWAETD